MSEWARPGPDGPVEETRIEVPLAGGDADPDDESSRRRGPNWRKVSGLSALAGIALGLVVATVVLTAGSDDDPPETTLDPGELSDAITVPPTLSPVTEPAAAVPATSPASGQPGTVVSDLELVAASVETLPARPDGDVEPPDRFRLSDGSLAALDTPLARRSVTDYVVGVDGFKRTVTTTNDPVTGRYLVELDSGGDTVPSFIVDLLGGFTWAETAPGEWVSIRNDEVAADAGVTDMATFVRNLQLGPIRSDTRNAWELVQSNGIVDAPGEELREWVVVLDATAVPEWARYAFGPGGEAAPLPGNTKVGFAVYVAADGSIRRVSGAAEYGATSQRIVHHIEVLDTPPMIELPVVDEPVTPGPAGVGSVPASAPTTDPTTTSPPR